jgi:hypothetical protein
VGARRSAPPSDKRSIPIRNGNSSPASGISTTRSAKHRRAHVG